MAVPLVIGWHLNGCVPDGLEEAEEAPEGLLVGGTLVIVFLPGPAAVFRIHIH